MIRATFVRACIEMLKASFSQAHAPLVAVWTIAILLIVYMIASASILENEAAQIAQEVRELLFPEIGIGE